MSRTPRSPQPLIPVAVICGPTASGKTECAHALAERLPVELITCDSMQVYRDMDILSQAPSPDDRARHFYHLTAFLDPAEEFNAARFAAECRRLCGEISLRGKLPVVVCGTGFYLTAFTQGVAAGPGENIELRDQLRRRAEERGVEELHRELAAKDPEAARTLHPNDARRVIRALELISITGELYSVLKARREAPGRDCQVRAWGLDWERNELYRRIDQRAEWMMEQGLVGEVKKLLSRPTLSKTARSCLGVAEMSGLISGQTTRETALASLKQNTRRFAKRQMTWFRHHDPVRWIPIRERAELDRAKQVLAEEITTWYRGLLV